MPPKVKSPVKSTGAGIVKSSPAKASIPFVNVLVSEDEDEIPKKVVKKSPVSKDTTTKARSSSIGGNRRNTSTAPLDSSDSDDYDYRPTRPASKSISKIGVKSPSPSKGVSITSAAAVTSPTKIKRTASIMSSEDEYFASPTRKVDTKKSAGASPRKISTLDTDDLTKMTFTVPLTPKSKAKEASNGTTSPPSSAVDAHKMTMKEEEEVSKKDVETLLKMPAYISHAIRLAVQQELMQPPISKGTALSDEEYARVVEHKPHFRYLNVFFSN
jgi:hypothetical protein